MHSECRAIALVIALLPLLACDDDAKTPSRDAGTSTKLDAGLDARAPDFCEQTVDAALGVVPRGCVYEAPTNSVSQKESGKVVVRVDGGQVASHDVCPCSSPTIEVIPQGSDAESYVPPACNLDVAKYTRSCTRNDDCVAVASGDVCSAPCAQACPNSALNVSSEAAYNADLAQLKRFGTFFQFCSCPCIGSLACVDGQCVLSACKPEEE